MGQGYQLFLEARWNEKCLINFRKIAQKQIPPLEWVDPAGSGLEWAPKIKFYYANPQQGAIFVCWPSQNYKCIYPHLVGWTLRTPCWGEPPTNIILPGKPTPRSKFCLLAFYQFSMHIFPFVWMDPAGPGFEWAPTKKNYRTNQPWGANFFWWLPLNSLCIHPLLVGWTLWGWDWGEPPTNKILPGKPTPRSNFCLLAPAQFSKHTPPFDRVDPAGPRFGWAPHK